MKLKLFLFALLAQCVSLTTMAYDAEIDGIYYNFSGTEACVVSGDVPYSGAVVIPQSVIYNGDTYYVTRITEQAFGTRSELTSISLPEGLKDIGSFWGCTSLGTITIPKSVTYIRNSAFAFCGALTAIVVADGNPVYDSRNGCNAIIETASNTLIRGCVNTIIPDEVTTIGEYAFSGCKSLTSITIPNSITTIGARAFSSCSDYVYGTCNGPTSIFIPASVTSIGEAAFECNSGLESIIVEEGNPNYDSRNSCNAIIETASNTLIGGCVNTIIPKGVTGIGWGAFEGCSRLSSIIIPEGVTSIDMIAFGYCYNLTSISFPESLISWGGSLFNYCGALSNIKVCAKTPITITYSHDPFSGSQNIYKAKLFVPRGSKTAYQMTDYWRNFNEIVEYNYVYTSMADLPIAAGGTKTIEIGLNNDCSDIVAFQMDLTLPKGVSIDQTGCSLSSRITDEEQKLTVGKLENGAYRLTSSSLSLTPISGVDGTLLTLKFTAADNSVSGQATISNVRFSTSDSKRITMPDETFGIRVLHKYGLTYILDGEVYKIDSVMYDAHINIDPDPTKDGYTFGGWSEVPETMPAHDVEVTGCFYLYGDVNTDEEVDVVDIVDIARFVVGIPSGMFREKLADLNKDKAVNLGDAVTLVNHIAGDQSFVKAMNSSSKNVESGDALSMIGKDKALSLMLNNQHAYTAFQFDLYISGDAKVENIYIPTERDNKHHLFYNRMRKGHYRVAVLSTSNRTFNGDDGELLSFIMDAEPSTDTEIRNIHFFDTKGNDYAFDAIGIDLETDVRSMQDAASKVQGPIYDLQGRTLTKMQRGLNIVRGKKFLQK